MPAKRKPAAKRNKTVSDQQNAVVHIISGLQPGEVAKRVGVADRTLRSWYSDDGFVEMLGNARSEASTRSLDAVGALGEESIAGLRNAIAAAVATIHDGGFDPVAAGFLLRCAESAVLHRLPDKQPTGTTESASRVIIELPDNGREDRTPLAR
jgi:hypothetical protein